MFERLQSFLAGLANNTAQPQYTADDPRVAVMALCIQVMDADGQTSKVERDATRAMLRDYYQLDQASLDALVDAGESAESEAIDFYRFTSDIKRHLTEEQRIELVGMLWQIAYTEIFSTSVMWPDFRKSHLVDAIFDYQNRERRFGLTGEQLRGGSDGGG